MGSKRCHSDYDGICTIPQLGSGPDNNTHGSGFYTVQDYKDILKYANERHIQVIPEIETPGHATAAIVAMEYRESKILEMKKHGNKNVPKSYLLSKHTNKNEIFSPQKWTRNAMNPCLNTTYDFVETVVDDLIELHRDVQPLTVLHLGGDEVPSGAWDDSKACLDMLDKGETIKLVLCSNTLLIAFVFILPFYLISYLYDFLLDISPLDELNIITV
jgi:hexosaminidase